MKRIRFVSVLLSWACFVCLCSIGFSSWYQFDPVNAEANGSFVGYGTVNMDECVYAESGSFKVFEYSSLSFVTTNSTEVVEEDVGQIRVTYIVNVANTKNAIEAEGKTWTGSLSVRVDLGYENLADYGEGANFKGLFLLRADARADSRKEITVTVNGAASSTSPSISTAGDRISFTQSFSGLSGTETLELDVVYHFNVPKCYTGGTEVGNFRNHFGKYLKTAQATGGATRFTTTAWIVELRGE